MTPRAVLPKCGSADFPSARTRYRVSDTESWGLGWKLNTIVERDVVERMTVLVDEDRHRRLPFQLGPVVGAGGQRLLAILEIHLRQVLDRFVERPVLVHVDLQRQVGDAADRAHALDVEPVARAELQLQATETSFGCGPLRAPRHVVRIAEPDRPGRRRAAAS